MSYTSNESYATAITKKMVDLVVKAYKLDWLATLEFQPKDIRKMKKELEQLAKHANTLNIEKHTQTQHKPTEQKNGTL